jgi:uroporphyrin-III C-methyltransferase
MSGKVYLVGAGPGDPELLTIKALRLLRTADAVLHDDLVSPEIVKFAASSAQVYNVGKRCERKTDRPKKVQQEEINFLMITLASTGMQVVRLKSGDPLVFGRAGEEIDALARVGIAYEIVPGVTSALAAAAAAGISLTHREKSSALVLIAGHRAGDDSEPDWKRLVSSGATLVVYMPGDDYGGIARGMTAAGLPAGTPCVIVSGATSREQQIHRTAISRLALAPRFRAPTLLIVGEVAGSEVEQSAGLEGRENAALATFCSS